MTHPTFFSALKADLFKQGFGLCDMHPVNTLPDHVWLDSDRPKQGTLLLVGHAGTKLWQQLKPQDFQEEHPIDTFSIKTTKQALDKHLPGLLNNLLFPHPHCNVNLVALGHAFGWHSASPLGMGIHQYYGLWTAFRALWWLDIETETCTTSKANTTTDLCTQCQSQACVNSCPAQALQRAKSPNLTRCANYRLQGQQVSLCHSRCVARIACPIATEHQYSREQLHYHYDLARSAIEQYKD